MSPHAPPTSRPAPESYGRRDLTGWLIGQTRGLLAPLALAVAARVLGQLLGVALFVFAAAALLAAAGLPWQHTGSPLAGLVPAGITQTPLLLLPVAVWLIGIAVAKALLRYGEHYAGHYVAFTSLQRLREAFITRLIPQAPAATQGRAGAELTGRATSDIDRIEVFFAHTLPPAVSALAVPAAALAWLALAVDARLAGVLAVAVLTLLSLPVLTRRGAAAAADGQAAARGRIAARLGDDIQGMSTVLGFGIAESRRTGLAGLDETRADAAAAVGRSQAVRAGAAALIQLGGLLGVLVCGAGLNLPVGPIVVSLAVGIGLIGPARGFEDYITGLDNAFAAAARVRHVMDAPPAVTDTAPETTATEQPTPAGASDPADASGTAPEPPIPAGASGTATEPAVSLEAVTFSYAADAARPTLEDVSFTAPAGVWTCIVGVSGSGKSTIAGLLLRGWDPQSGTVRLAGRDVRSLPLDELRARIALAPQRPTTLSASVRENLTLAAPQATDEEIAAALTTAGAAEWIGRLDERLGTRGASVSGGQLQRLSLARALLAAPEVLIIDEGLSQLDAATAAGIRQRLAARTDLTIIEITHRADLIADDSPVVVLDSGRVVQTGTAAELRSAPGPFARLLDRVQ